MLFGTLSFALGPVVQNAVIEAARVPGGSLVSAANQGAFNVANAVGAALGALVISSGLGLHRPDVGRRRPGAASGPASPSSPGRPTAGRSGRPSR